MMKGCAAPIVSLSCLLSVISTLAGSPSPSKSTEETKIIARVYIDVSGEPEIKDLIKSGILRRLRQFKDVKIENEADAATQSLFLMAEELTLKSEAQSGYAISVVRTSKPPWIFIASDLSSSTHGLAQAEIGRQIGVSELSVRRAVGKFMKIAGIGPGGLRPLGQPRSNGGPALKENGQRVL